MKNRYRYFFTWFAIFLSISACTDRSSAFSPEKKPVVAAKKNSPYRHALNTCLYGTQRMSPCSLSELPFLGQDKETPTLEDLMNRVAVSDDYLGANFEILLKKLPESAQHQIFLLARSVTGIVISDDIDRSYYSSTTGAIYLESRYLNLDLNLCGFRTSSTITQAEETKSIESVKQLSFVGLFGLVRSKPVLDNIDCLAQTLFHELSHAADSLPASLVSHAPRNQNAAELIQTTRGQRVSDLIAKKYPLRSRLLHQIATILYQNQVPHDEEKRATAQEIAEEFEKDLAVSLYSYTSQYEDVAEISEAFLLLSTLGISKLIVFAPATVTVDELNNHCYHSTWGRYRRFMEPSMREKVRFIMERILPEYAKSVDWNALTSSSVVSPNTCFIVPIG